MNTFSKKFTKSLMFHSSTAWFLSQCSEARGMQEMWGKVRPEVLSKLRESAIIHSTESSNRIEGVIVSKKRLMPLVIKNVKPKNRSEEEIVGYKNALDYIHTNFEKIEITPKVIKKLHKLAQGGMIPDAGEWKKKNNDIIEINSLDERSIRFKPISATKTPHAIEQLCLGYNDVVNNNLLPELICVANFILDFLCIHPFRDGNGRVSRLLTLLLLHQHGYEVGKYISLEKLIEESKENYYRVLKEASMGWHEQKFNLLSWWNYFLGIIKSAYQELKDKVEFTGGSDNKSSVLKQSILNFEGHFSISDVINLHPLINRELIKKVLSKMKNEKLIKSTGRGRSAKWIKILKNPENSTIV